MRYENLPRDAKSGEVLSDKVEFPFTYTLLKPIGDRTEVEVREPTVLDLEMAHRKNAAVERSITMYSNLMELTPDEVRQMSMRDFSKLAEALGTFLS